MADEEKKTGDLKDSHQGLWWPGIVALGMAVLVVVLVLVLGGGDAEPHIPSGAIAVIEHAPDGMGEITKAEFVHELAVNAAFRGLRATPKPGESAYDELGREAVESLIKRVWITGQAEELGLTVSPKELAGEVKKAKHKQFESEAEFKEYLGIYHQTASDFKEAIKKESLNAKIEDWLKKHVPKQPSQDEIESYYDEYKANFKPQPERVSIEIVVNKDREKVERAKAAVEGSEDFDIWEKVAMKFSEDPASKDSGSESVEEDELGEPLNAAVFKAPEVRLEGPIKTPEGFVIFERRGRTLPTKLQSLEEMEKELNQQLTPQAKSRFIGEFGTEFNERWGARTFCAPPYGVELCANYDIPIKVGMCLKQSEEGKGSVVPCSPGTLRVTGNADSSDECSDKSAQIHTAPGDTKVFCVEQMKTKQKGRK